MSAAGNGVRLLYIDDDRGLSRLVEKELTRHGYDVTCALDGDAGLERLRDGVFDVIALDHYMPTRDGLDVLPEILAVPAAPPVVYVTGAQDGRIAVAALRAGAADYVIKDVSEDFTALLRAALEDALERRRLSRANEEAQEEVRLARDRAEAMLREVNHRVGNSLQLVSSFISLQLRQMKKDDAGRLALQDAQVRIEAVAQVHRRLYTSADMASVALDEYLEGLVDELVQSLCPDEGAPCISLKAEPLRVDTDQAVSLGVVVTELVTNAVKYAYTPGNGGDIRVLLERQGEARAVLTVEDDGPGMGDGKPKGTGLGGKIISAMAHGLKSRLEIDPEHTGVRARMVFDL
jgi:two-component sensor histidine kinase